MRPKQALKECQIFSALSDTELEKIASLVVEKQYDAGTAIFREGDNAQELFVLQEGKVALQMMIPEAPGQMSKRVTVDVVSENEAIGWSALVEPYSYTLTAVCLQKVKAFSINGAKLRSLLEGDPKFGFEAMKGLIKMVASRLDDTRRVLVSERTLIPKVG